MENKLFLRLSTGRVVLGLCNMYPAPGIIEGMCKGWDFVWIDEQHGQYSYDNILHAVRAATCIGIDSVVRVPGHAYEFLGPIADILPSGIMVPMVNTALEAKEVVDSLRFAPLGKRSYGGRRAIDFGGREFFKNQKIVLIPQIETLKALENVNEIAKIKGIDCLFFGPDDVKVQLGLPINTPINESKDLRDAMICIVKAAQKAGIYAGCPAATPEVFSLAIDLGYSLIIGGGDSGFLRVASQNKLFELHAILTKEAKELI